MSTESEFTPIVRLSLKKGDPWARIREDLKLSESSLVFALGEQAEEVMKLALMKRSPDKVVMFQQGEVGDSLYFVVSGTVRLFARKDRDSLELPSIGIGDVIGETEVLGGAPHRHQSAIAQGVVELIEIPRKSLLVDGMLPAPIESLLNRIRKTRDGQLDELTTFMNRW